MKRRNGRELIVLTSVLFGALVGGAGMIPLKERPDEAVVALIGGRTQESADRQDEDIVKVARKAFMRGKLSSNQKIVEGISTKNYELIKEGAEEVKALVKGQHWFVLQTKEYQEFSAEMQLAAGRLATAAEARSIDGATLRYLDLTLNCVDCHNYIEKQKY